MFSLFRLPLGAFQPHDVLYVFDRDGHIAGLLRVERETQRDEWTVVELDAVGGLDAGDVRFRLVQHLLRDGAKRGVARFHVACADADDNVELFMQAGFVRYGDERVLFRPPGRPLPAPLTEEAARRSRDPARGGPGRGGALAAVRDRDPGAGPAPGDASGWRTGSGRAASWRVPRSSLVPILRFADVEAYVQEAPGGGRDGTQLDAFVQVGVAKEDQPHYLKLLARPEADVVPLLRYALGVIAARADAVGAPSARACSRPCEPTSRRSTGAWRRRASTRSPPSRS